MSDLIKKVSTGITCLTFALSVVSLCISVGTLIHVLNEGSEVDLSLQQRADRLQVLLDELNSNSSSSPSGNEWTQEPMLITIPADGNVWREVDTFVSDRTKGFCLTAQQHESEVLGLKNRLETELNRPLDLVYAGEKFVLHDVFVEKPNYLCTSTPPSSIPDSGVAPRGESPHAQVDVAPEGPNPFYDGTPHSTNPQLGVS